MARMWADKDADADTDVHTAVLGPVPAGSSGGDRRPGRPLDPQRWSALVGWTTAGVLAVALVVSWAGPPRRVGVPVVVTPSPKTVTATATVTRGVPVAPRASYGGPSRAVQPYPAPAGVPGRTVVPVPSVSASATPPPAPEPSRTGPPVSATPQPTPAPAPDPPTATGTPPAPSTPPTFEPVEETSDERQ